MQHKLCLPKRHTCHLHLTYVYTCPHPALRDQLGAPRWPGKGAKKCDHVDVCAHWYRCAWNSKQCCCVFISLDKLAMSWYGQRFQLSLLHVGHLLEAWSKRLSTLGTNGIAAEVQFLECTSLSLDSWVGCARARVTSCGG